MRSFSHSQAPRRRKGIAVVGGRASRLGRALVFELDSWKGRGARTTTRSSPLGSRFVSYHSPPPIFPLRASAVQILSPCTSEMAEENGGGRRVGEPCFKSCIFLPAFFLRGSNDRHIMKTGIRRHGQEFKNLGHAFRHSLIRRTTQRHSTFHFHFSFRF